mmetsp:Transcript_47511/g.54696  ORF Transcript_47511/g.54696 Transcript_47511/m.54696 type:complete len:84 (+) Transcript_47511:155-406(+)
MNTTIVVILRRLIRKRVKEILKYEGREGEENRPTGTQNQIYNDVRKFQSSIHSASNTAETLNRVLKWLTSIILLAEAQEFPTS